MNVSRQMAQSAAINADGESIRCIWYRNRRDGWSWDYIQNLTEECYAFTVYFWTGFGWRVLR